MSSQPQIVYSLCFQSEDAVERKGGKFIFEMSGDNPRMKPNKVMLGSVEFPMVQYTIEEKWNNVYFMERIKLFPGHRSLVLEEDDYENEIRRLKITLPIELNPIKSWSSSIVNFQRETIVEFEL